MERTINLSIKTCRDIINKNGESFEYSTKQIKYKEDERKDREMDNFKGCNAHLVLPVCVVAKIHN
jgi:hypothetical protein